MGIHRPPLQVIAVREKASGLAASCLAMAQQALHTPQRPCLKPSQEG